MKRIISLLTVLIISLSVFSLSAGAAVSLSEGDDALMDQFTFGFAGQHDYVSFSPVKNRTDKTKYPLFIWMHGKNSGFYSGMQLTTTEIYNWSSEEFQSRFVNAGGSFIFLPRSKGNASVWSVADLPTLKYTIDRFIAANAANIDTSRIYIAGNSVGGMMVYKMCAAYPNFFAGALLPSAVYEPSAKELRSMANLPVWIFTNVNDEYEMSRADTVTDYFDTLSYLADEPSIIRMTTCTKAIWGDKSVPTQSNDQHYIWGTVTNDMFMDDGSPYKYATTVDGTGAKIAFTYPNGVINWLSSQELNRTANTASTSSIFQQLSNFINIMMNWFMAFFK